VDDSFYLKNISLELPDVPQALDYTCGAACFDSMYRYFFRESPGEMFFAEQLGTLKLGYTDPESIPILAKKYGLKAEITLNAQFQDLVGAFSERKVVFVTWWDEDAGHYSLIKKIERDHITLMDPWTARESRDNRLPLEYFLANWRLRGSKMICAWPSSVIPNGPRHPERSEGPRA